MRLPAHASRARLICLLVCLSLLAQALLPVTAGAAGGAGKALPPAAKAQAGQEAEAANLPDLDEARRRPRQEPNAIPPVPSTRRRCPPRNPHCNDGDGAPRPTPTPAPASTPAGHGNPHGLASASAPSFASLVGAAFGGRTPLMDLSLLDFYSGGGYSVSDAPARLMPAAAYAAAPAEPYQGQPGRLNVAAASNGGVATASTTYTAAGSFPAAGAIDGDHVGANWGSGGGWNDSTADTYPDWLQVNFAAAKTIDEIDLYTLQDALGNSASEPTESMTFTQYGIVNFDVQYWTGSGWQTVPGGSVTGNNKVWRKVTFPAVTTTKVRVLVNAALDVYSRVVEVEAWGGGGATEGLPPGTGLTGEYYNGSNFDTYVLARADAAINFDWGAGSPHPSVSADNFSARWTGMVVPRYSETYTFYAAADDGVRLWIDGQLILDRWQDQASELASNPIALEAGRAYSIRMEYYEHAGGATAQLRWASSSQAKEIVPQSRLYGCWKGSDQFARDFYQGALGRQPSAAELQDWAGRLNQAQGDYQLLAEAQGLGAQVFASAEYAARGRADTEYVSDLYLAYLQRAPDAGA